MNGYSEFCLIVSDNSYLRRNIYDIHEKSFGLDHGRCRRCHF